GAGGGDGPVEVLGGAVDDLTDRLAGGGVVDREACRARSRLTRAVDPVFDCIHEGPPATGAHRLGREDLTVVGGGAGNELESVYTTLSESAAEEIEDPLPVGLGRGPVVARPARRRVAVERPLHEVDAVPHARFGERLRHDRDVL